MKAEDYLREDGPAWFGPADLVADDGEPGCDMPFTWVLFLIGLICLQAVACIASEFLPIMEIGEPLPHYFERVWEGL